MLSIGAEGESRTPTPLPELDPEPSVSTNSTTSARKFVYRIRPPLASFFLDFSHFLFLARKIKRIQTAPTGFPAENGRTDARRLRAPPRIGSREDAAVYQTSPKAGMEPPAVVTSSGDAVKTRDGPRPVPGQSSLLLHRQPIFRRLAARPRPEKRKEPTCAALPHSLPGPCFALPLSSGVGTTFFVSMSCPRHGRYRPAFLPVPPPVRQRHSGPARR